MNDQELKRWLRSAEVPARPEAYWREFPKRVTARLHWKERANDTEGKAGWIYKLTWGLATLALVGVVASLIWEQKERTAPVESAGHSENQIAEVKKCFREVAAMFPNQVAAIVFDQQGPKIELTDKADVPTSTPYYLKLCGPGGCKQVVTFSGQQIEFNGEKCEVLADGRGSVLIVGNDHVWSGGDKTASLRIEAEPLANARL